MENSLPLLHAAGHHGPHPGMFIPLILIGVAFWVLRRNGRLGPIGYDPSGAASGRPAATPESDAFETLRQRLANGDITPEEYLERSSVLRRPNSEN